MRVGTREWRASRLSGLLLAVIGLLVAAAPAGAAPSSGAAFTTINSSVDGTGTSGGEGLCHNGNPNVNCNQYFSKRFVWINGGPDGNGLSDGQYFFAVLVPGMQHDPNDQVPVSTSDKNLSDDFDTYQNRTFTVTGGEISAYSGTHDFASDPNDNNENKIRLFPYSDTTNNGGVYILAICSLEPDRKGNTYPVTPQDCKFDAFKIREDDTPPDCPSPTFGVNASGQKTATQLFQDPGGIDFIEILKVTNATIAPLQPGVNWFQGTTSLVTLTATKIDQARGSSIEILVSDVAGNRVRCDPVLTTLRIRDGAVRAKLQRYRVTSREDTVTIRNGLRGLDRVTVRVNGTRFIARNLRPGEQRKLRIGSALRRGRRNTVALRGFGPPGGRATIMIAN
jgi:hypothetical protein